MASPAAQLDVLISTTLANYMRTLTDNVFTALPALDEMKKNGKVMLDGGTDIREPILYGKSTSAQRYVGADTLDTTNQSGIAYATFDWKQYAVTVVISGLDSLKNSGKEAVIKLLEAKTQQAEASVMDIMATDIYSDGTNGSSKALGGLALLASTGTPVTNPGGIDESTETWWQNLRPSANANFGSSQTSASGGYQLWLNTYNAIWKTRFPAKFLFCSQDPYESYERLLAAQVRYTSADENAGYSKGAPVTPSLKFKGAKAIYDPYVPGTYSGANAKVYFAGDTLKLAIHKDANFVHKPAQQPVNQDVYVSKILWAGNLVTNGRRSLAVTQHQAA